MDKEYKAQLLVSVTVTLLLYMNWYILTFEVFSYI